MTLIEGNLTQTFGIDSESLPKTLYDILVDNITADQVLRCLTEPPDFALIGSNLDLADTTLAVSGLPYWGALLRDALQPVLPRFRYVVIDCPPGLDALTVNALVAATDIVVPVEMGAFSLRGTSRLLKVVNNVRKLNPSLPAPRFLASARRRRACRTPSATSSSRVSGTASSRQPSARARRSGRRSSAAAPWNLRHPTARPPRTIAPSSSSCSNG